MWLWLIAGFGALTATAALLSVRRLRRGLDSLNQSYWELRYEYTRLRSQVSRLDVGHTAEPEAAEAQPLASVSYVPLSSLKPAPPKS